MQESKSSSLRALAGVTFLNYAARGLTLPFINLYLVSVGFSGTQIGIVLSISAFVRLIIPPMLLTIADRTGRHRRLYYGFVTGNAAATVTLIASAAKLPVGAAVVIRDSLDMPGASLLSQLTITKLQEQSKDIYGRLRAWGSLGWAVMTMISGKIYDLGGYGLLFLIAAALNLAALPLARTLPTSTITEKNKVPRQSGLRRTKAFYVLMAAWFLFFVGMSGISGFMFIYFQQELGASNTTIGILASVAALAEIPSMIVIDHLLRHIRIRLVLMIGILGMASLWVVYTFLTDTSLLLPLMLVRGTFYTFQTVGITLMVSRVSNPENAATNQAISQVTVPALALLITGPIAGWGYDNLGPRVLFRIVSMTAVLAIIVLIAARTTLTTSDFAVDNDTT